MKISKEFTWEMGHRLPSHEGLCKNIHGHSYKMIITLEGDTDSTGMIIDFYELGKIIKPVIDIYDHAFMCKNDDLKVKEFLTKNKMKRVIVTYHSTVENICSDIAEIIAKHLKKLKHKRIYSFSIKLFETPNSYAEKSYKL